MSNDTLKLYKEVIYADKVYDVNFKNVSITLYEEIERIKKDNEYLNQVNIELSTEKNRLNNLLKETSQTLSEQTTKAITLKSENERLNNIINELENYIRARADDNNTCSVCSVMTDDLLNILQGSDKE